MIFGTLLMLIIMPSLACTRTANSPQQLTAIAERAAVLLATEAVRATEDQRLVTPSATFTTTPTDTQQPQTATAIAETLNAASPTPTFTLTAAPTEIPTITPTVPTPRSTYPVETIAPSTATATPEYIEPTLTPTPDIPLPDLYTNFSNKKSCESTRSSTPRTHSQYHKTQRNRYCFVRKNSKPKPLR